MIRFMFAITFVCLFSNISVAQPQLIPPAPSETGSPAAADSPVPTESATSVPAANPGAVQDALQPQEDAPAPSSGQNYESVPGYHSPVDESRLVHQPGPGSDGCACSQIATGYSGQDALFPSTPGDDTHLYMGGAYATGLHARHPYYYYRHSWFTPGPVSHNVTIVW